MWLCIMWPLVKYQSVFPEWCLGHLTYFNFSRFYWNNLFLKDVMFKHMQFKKEQTFCRLWNLSESSGLVIFLIVGGDIPAFFFRSCDILNLRDKHCSQSWLITRQTRRKSLCDSDRATLQACNSGPSSIIWSKIVVACVFTQDYIN